MNKQKGQFFKGFHLTVWVIGLFFLLGIAAITVMGQSVFEVTDSM